MKAFISQPMNGLSDEDIIEVRDTIWHIIQDKHGDDCEIIDSYNYANAMSPLECLGEGIKFMEQADVVYFAPDWEEARGCVVEHAVAEFYGIPRVELSEL